MQHKIFLVNINPIRTVSPQRHALSISGLAAAIKTPTLRKNIEVMRKNEKRKNTTKLKRKQVYLSSIAQVAVQFVDIVRTLKERFYSNNFLFLSILQHSGILYLTGVSRAGLWNVTFVHSFTARHTSHLILSEGIDNVECR